MSGSDGEEGRRERNTVTNISIAATATEEKGIVMDDDGPLAATAVKQYVDDVRFPRSVNRRRHDDGRRDETPRVFCETNEAGQTRMFVEAGNPHVRNFAKVRFPSTFFIQADRLKL